jgi:hypothetical protein
MLDEEAFHRDYLSAWLEVAAAAPALAAGVATAADAALGRYGSWLDALGPGAAAAGVPVPPSGADLAAAVGELMTRSQHAPSVP